MSLQSDREERSERQPEVREQDFTVEEKIVRLKELFDEQESAKLSRFYKIIAHGDAAHRAWLKGVIEGYFKIKLKLDDEKNL